MFQIAGGIILAFVIVGVALLALAATVAFWSWVWRGILAIVLTIPICIIGAARTGKDLLVAFGFAVFIVICISAIIDHFRERRSPTAAVN